MSTTFAERTSPTTPCIPPFQERLGRFRQRENTELFHRGAEQVVHNVCLYDTRRSSEDHDGELPTARQEDTAKPGPTEAVVGAEDDRANSTRQNGYRGDREDDNSFGRTSIVARHFLQTEGK